MPEETQRSKFHFNYEISMGHVLQIVAMIAAVLTAYFTLDNRVAQLETANPAQTQTVEKVIRLETQVRMMEAQVKTDQAAMQVRLSRIEAKLDRLIERGD